MQPPTAEALLRAWERGRNRHPVDRALLLHGLAAPDAEPESLADEPLGRRNVALTHLHQELFGRRIRADLACPGCGTRLQCELDAAALLATPASASGTVEVDGLAFRLPTSRDLASILEERDPSHGALILARRCLTAPAIGADDARLETLLDRVEDALERADPWADVTVDVHCEVCGHAWTSPLDLARFVWDEVEAYAVRVLDEIHLLAHAYGWSEPEILALSDSRRTAYLDRVTA